MTELWACTIVTRDRLPHARVLAESFLHAHPEARIGGLLLEGELPLPSREPFEVLLPRDIGLDERRLHELALVYDRPGLALAVEPILVRSLLDRGARAVVYLAPDTWIAGRLDPLLELVRDHVLALVPFTTEPIPSDDRDGVKTLLHGQGPFDVGCLAVAPGGREAIEWWLDAVDPGAYEASVEGYVDPHFIAALPALFDVAICRDEGVNVGYWNAFQRPISVQDGTLVAGRAPLRSLRFAGFDPESPWVFSTLEGSKPRVLLSEQPELARLCEAYASSLEQRGYSAWRGVPYAFERLPGGCPVDWRMRKVVGAALRRKDPAERPPDPFDGDRPDAFLEWLREPSGPRGVPRYLEVVLERNPLCARAFRDVPGLDLARFLSWSTTEGRTLEELRVDHLPAPRARPWRPIGEVGPRLEPGVTLVLPAPPPPGAPDLESALVGAQVVHSTVRIAPPARPGEDAGIEGDAVHDTSLVWADPEFLELVRGPFVPELLDVPTIAAWADGVSLDDPRARHLEHVDEVWVLSESESERLGARLAVRVLVVPPEAVAQRIEAVREELRHRSPERLRMRTLDGPLATALGLAEHGPDWSGPSRLGPLGRGARRLLRRLLRPYEARQREVMRAIVQAIAADHHSLRVVDRQLAIVEEALPRLDALEGYSAALRSAESEGSRAAREAAAVADLLARQVRELREALSRMPENALDDDPGLRTTRGC